MKKTAQVSAKSNWKRFRSTPHIWIMRTQTNFDSNSRSSSSVGTATWSSNALQATQGTQRKDTGSGLPVSFAVL